jgi:hypothetical protein
VQFGDASQFTRKQTEQHFTVRTSYFRWRMDWSTSPTWWNSQREWSSKALLLLHMAAIHAGMDIKLNATCVIRIVIKLNTVKCIKNRNSAKGVASNYSCNVSAHKSSL